MDKLKQLKRLARKRKRTRWVDYKCLGDYHVDNRYPDGYYECKHVSPYTKTAGNVDSPIMVMLQDWSSDDKMKGKRDSETKKYGFYPRLRTNRKLNRLLKEHYNCSFEDIYATNLFPFIKLGGISAAIPRKDLIRAAVEFALPQIDIVRPRLVVCLGLETFSALRKASGGLACFRLEEAIRSPFDYGLMRIWCQAHPANRNRGGKRVSNDWKRMKADVPI